MVEGDARTPSNTAEFPDERMVGAVALPDRGDRNMIIDFHGGF